jgi:hypothetical protein
MWVRAMRVMSWKPPSCWHGGRSTRPWWDESGGVRHVSAWFVDASSVALRSGWSWHVLTTPVQARFPIDAGGVGFHGKVGQCMESSVGLRYGPLRRGLVRYVSAMSVEVCHGTKLVQARCWINASGLGCDKVRRVQSRSVVVGPGWSMPGKVGHRNRHRGRRGEASTPRGGMHYGMVRRVEFGHGPVW